MNGDKANLATRRLLSLQPHPTFTNHNGGEVMIGPDGMLYIGFGDGGSGGDPNGNGAEPRPRWLGKILRIDPRPTATTPYRIPPTTPSSTSAGVRRRSGCTGCATPGGSRSTG